MFRRKRERETEEAADAGVQSGVEAPRKRRYYNPGEVMRKKGCIGCGGMVLAVPFLASLVGLMIALF
jgi:hypothetical protein